MYSTPKTIHKYIGQKENTLPLKVTGTWCLVNNNDFGRATTSDLTYYFTADASASYPQEMQKD